MNPSKQETYTSKTSELEEKIWIIFVSNCLKDHFEN